MVLLIFICLFGIATTSVATTNKGPILQNWELKLVEDIFGQCNNDIDCPKGLICEKNACQKPENAKLIQRMDCMDKISSKKCKKLKKKGKCEDKKIYKKCMLTCQRCSPVTCDPATTCSGHGTCTEDGSCKCSDGFYGDSCSIACNAAQNCSNQGICGPNGACDCDCGFYMEDCSNYCHLQSKCNGHGTCKNDGSCQCLVGFYGDNCSTTTPITEAEAECLSFGNSTYINDTCFYVEMGLFNYTDAMVNCQNQFGPNNTGKLFEPKDSSTNDQVIEFAKNLILPSTKSLHIGFNDIATEGTWQYTTGGDLVYTNWGGIAPNNGASGNGEDCGETYFGTTWNDDICSHEQPSICEMISTGGICVEYGIDYPYHDINTIDNVYPWTECAKHCHDSKACQFWSWRMDQYRCYLKTSKNNRERAGNAISGAYDCLSEC